MLAICRTVHYCEDIGRGKSLERFATFPPTMRPQGTHTTSEGARTMETQNTPTAEVVESYRVTIRCKYLSPTNHRGSRISVQRWDSPAWGKDPNRMVIGWDYSKNTGENYAEAVRQYVARAEWEGPWITSTVPDGAVAVWGGILAEDKAGN